MKSKTFTLAAIAVGGVGLAFARGDWLIVPALGMGCVTVELVRRLVARVRQLPPRQQRLQVRRASVANPVRSGVMFGTSIIVLTLLCHTLLARIPEIQEYRFDHDRSQFEAVLEQFEENRHFSEAADLIAKRLEGSTSHSWRELLAKRQYRCLLLASRGERSDRALAILEQALACSKRHGLDHFAADELIVRIGAGQRSAQLHADASAREQAALATTDELKRLGRGKLTSMAATVADELLKCGDALGDQLGPRRDKYLAAIAWCERYGLSDSTAKQKLAALERLSALRMPVNLSTGVKAKVVAQRLELFPPLVVLDLAITDATGSHLPGLLAKDFTITRDGKPVDGCHLAPSRLRSEPWNLVLLFDRSGSTKGAPIQAAKGGLTNLVADLSGQANFKLISFAAGIEQRGDWFRDASLAAARVDTLQAEGGTALFGALDAAVRDLLRMPAPRGIILFSDGRDSVGGFASSDIIQRCRQASIAVHVVALTTPETDARLLQQLASETGGSNRSVAHSRELATSFRELAVKLQQPVYRIVIPTQDSAIRPVRIRVGGQNSVTLDHIPQVAVQK